MANIKLTELDPITALDSSDVLAAVDVSADETHKITAANLFRTLPNGTAAAPALAFGSDAANGVYLAGTDTVGIATGGTQRVTVDGSGNVTISGDLTVSGATTTVESTTVTIDDKNIELGSVASPSNTTADGGGITLKGATDKTIKWINSTGYWTFNTGIEVGGHLQIDDSNEIRLGTGQDLKIYHDGSNSYIKDAGTGNLILAGTRVNLLNAAANETLISAQSDGPVELYHNNVKKLETKSDGIDVTGEVQCDSLDVDGGVDIDGGKVVYDSSNGLKLDDNVVLRIGSGNDLNIYHNGNTSYIDEAGTGGLDIRSNQVKLSKYTGETLAQFIADGAVSLRYNNSVKFETKGDGVDVTGEVQCDSLDVDGAADISSSLNVSGNATFHGNLDLHDNDILRLGTGDDLQIYHDGSNSIIRNTTGHLKVRANTFHINNSDDNESMALFTADGSVRLFYDNSKKLETKSDGIDVTGEVQCDTLDVDGVVNIGAANTSDAQLEIGAGATGNRNAYVDLIGDTTYTDYGLRVQRDNGGANGASKILHRGTGDFRFVAQEAAVIEFFTSNLERLRIDASGRVMLGTTTEGHTSADDLTVSNTGGNCGITVRAGTTSSSSIFFSDGTSGDAEYRGQVQYSHSSDALFFNTAATERFRITSTGAWGIEGASNYGTSGQVLTSNGNDAPTWQDAGQASIGGANAISMNDNVKINFGDGNDLQIYHDGSNAYIDDAGTGNLKLNGNEVHIMSNDNSEYCARFISNGAVRLFYDNSKKFETKSDGVDIIGELQCDSLDVDGNVNFDGSHHYFSTSSTTHSSLTLKKSASGADPVDYLQCRDSSNTLKAKIAGSGEVECLSLDVNGTADISGATNFHANVKLQDNDTLVLGSGDDLQIYHDGTNSYINDTGTGLLNIKTNGTEITLTKSPHENLARFIIDGACELYHNNSKKLETTSTGVQISGDLGVGGVSPGNSFDNGKALALGDNDTGIRQAGDGILEFWSNNQERLTVHGNGTTYSRNHFVPHNTNSVDLGGTNNRWRNVYTNDLNLSNEGSSNDVDGTWGNYTIQEGEDDLFLINRRNGKKYKFNLTEVS